MWPTDPALLHDFPDRALRQLLQNPGNLRDLLTAAVPDLASGFDCERAELQPPVFPLDDWRRRESDLLFLIPYRAGTRKRLVLVCVLIEHQSTADPRMPLRMLLYTVLFWEREWKAWEDLSPPRPEFQLTPVLPIVFHTGARPWGAARTLAELVRGPEAFEAFLPRYSPLFWDLAEQSSEALISSAADWLQTLALLKTHGEEREYFFRLMRETATRLNPLASRDKVRWDGLMRFILAWALQRRPLEEREELIALVQGAQEDVRRREEVRTMSRTIADELRAEGREEGALGATRTLVLRIVKDKFGRVPKALRQQIAATADLERLQSCASRASRAQSLDEIGL